MTAELLQSLQQITGQAHTFAIDHDRAEPYRKQFGFIADRAANLFAVTQPDTVESLQAIVQLARKQGLGLWPTPNMRGNGAVAGNPKQPGILIDQHRMQRILEVNVESACALIEPGVSYQQLYDHLQKNHTGLWIDCDLDPDHSVVGSITARNYGYTPYGDHQLMQCGMEVVLANGELLRTGMGALPDSNTWQLFKYNFGPYIDGLFTQSSLAVISKIGLWLMPAPPVYKPFMLKVSGMSALAAVIEVMRPMKIKGVIPNTVSILPDPASSDRWKLFGALYGMANNVGLTWNMLSNLLSSEDGIKICLETDCTDDPTWQARQKLMQGTPVARGNDNQFSTEWHLTFSASVEGGFALQMDELGRRIVSQYEIAYRCEYLLIGRSMLYRIFLTYDQSTEAGRDNAIAAARQLLDTFTSAGFGIIDESLQLSYLVDRRFSGTGLADFNDRLQQALHIGR